MCYSRLKLMFHIWDESGIAPRLFQTFLFSSDFRPVSCSVSLFICWRPPRLHRSSIMMKLLLRLSVSSSVMMLWCSEGSWELFPSLPDGWGHILKLYSREVKFQWSDIRGFGSFVVCCVTSQKKRQTKKYKTGFLWFERCRKPLV